MDERLAAEEARRLPTETPLARAGIAAVRIVFGLLWLTQASWKTPPDFRLLRTFTGWAVEYPVLAPYSFFVEEVVLPSFTFFAWITMLTEIALGAFLLLGLATRFWAVVGFAQSMAITLSVINAPHEWSWAYYMMLAGHVAIWATAAGRTFGLDGRPARRVDPRRRDRVRPAAEGVMTRERRGAVMVLVFMAVVLGLAAAINGLGSGFMADRGQNLWRLFASNTFGGLLTVVGGLVAAGSVATRTRAPALLAGMLFLGMSGLTVIGIGQPWNLFGGRASIASFWLMLGAGLVALAISPEVRGGGEPSTG
jgi:thiosulfate dehydrogenase [quinone] large subunit